MRRTRLALALSLCLPAAAQAALPNGVAAGDVTQDSAVLWARSDAVGALNFEVATDPGFTNVVASYGAGVGDAMQPVKALASGLNAGTQYFYRATDSLGASEAGSFRTPHAGGANGLRFAVTGDWRGDVMPFPAIKNIPARNLDFMVLLGDTIYGDVGSPAVAGQATSLADYRAKHNEVLSPTAGLNAWKDARASTAVYATIDDHEVTNDFAGGAHPATDARFDNTGSFINQTQLYRNGLQAFGEYMPIQAQTWSGTGDARFDGAPKLYRSQRFGDDAAMFILDARSFRDAELPEVADITDPAQVGAFMAAAFDPGRTMLGQAQKAQLKADLLAAQADGTTWKFVMLPEPIQNFGPLAASDRFEGYAAERAEILKFVSDLHIDNIVFVTADIHGTVVNNLTYQDGPFQAQKPTQAWEISTGSVGYDAPMAQTVLYMAAQMGLIDNAIFSAFLAADVATQNLMFQGILSGLITTYGYDPLGLDGSGIPATLLQGSWTAASTYGWSEFEIDPVSHALKVTTYGVPYYDETFANAHPDVVAGLSPQVVSQFQVAAVPEPETYAMLLAGLGLVGWAARRRKA
ncbi:MAG: alkaline phosphatase D family protein [Pseudomonadota bacterium]